tara:strand:+ start:191 stop:505 length:315 start_codon:yes stop_codon:yes gene_type:complete
MTDKWDNFVKEYSYITEEIFTDLAGESHLFDTHDGIHAKFTQEGELGLLLVFDIEEADGLLAAFYAGLDGVDEATATFAMWAGSLMGMIRTCMGSIDDSIWYED